MNLIIIEWFIVKCHFSDKTEHTYQVTVKPVLSGCSNKANYRLMQVKGIAELHCCKTFVLSIFE